MAKVIACDNYNRESVADYLIKDGLTDEEAEAMATKLNRANGGDPLYYHKAVPDDYRLSRGMEDLI